MIVELCDKLIICVTNEIIKFKQKIKKTEQEEHYIEDLVDFLYKLEEMKCEWESNRFFPYICEMCNKGTLIRPLCFECHKLESEKCYEFRKKFYELKEKEGEL